jgi:threonyl-tRNA synthetase
MIKKLQIILPNGNAKDFETNVNGFEIASSISTSLAKKAIAIKVDGKTQDIYIPIEKNSSIEIITTDSPEGLEIIRHDCAHLLAQAVKELYPQMQVTIGPVIENGFYYDFAGGVKFTTDDLSKIEVKMLDIVNRKLSIRRELIDRDQAVEYFSKIGEVYKAKIIQKIPEGEEVSVYRHFIKKEDKIVEKVQKINCETMLKNNQNGDFYDLCRGPHGENLSFCKNFKLLKVSGSYWEGDSKNEQLQRIYGTAWASKSDLENYIQMLEEAERRDHRKIGTELDLFHISDMAVGSVFWHQKGAIIYHKIQNYIRSKLEKNGYIEVRTPLLMNKELWEKSGHWDKYRENMFVVDCEKSQMALKPMNCPAHVEIYNQGLRSYKDLPIRMAEFGCCHRNESSGSMHGIMRVRNFVQDDAHIFCTEEQIESEVASFCKLLMEVYKDFDFNEVSIKLSTRPTVRAGSDEFWDKAEDVLAKAVVSAGYNYEILPGEGAFYAPKLEFHLKDAIGRTWQCGTIQLDYVLPERFKASYIAEDGSKKQPVMLHRAILGTFERFIGILIENYAGKFPVWIAPVQVAICTITNTQDDYGKKVLKQLQDAGIRAVLDIESEKINAKIRKHSVQKVPILAILGKQEEQNQNLTIRLIQDFNSTNKSNVNEGEMSIQELCNIIKSMDKI